MQITTDSFLNVSKSNDRFELWKYILNRINPKNVLEIGVYEGDYAEYILKNLPKIDKYYMIDPWRHLEEWNKPANKDNDTFEKIYNKALKRTNFAKNKIYILRGKTTEKIEFIDDCSLDFVYIDGDHTLKGISIDLISILPKLKMNGWIGGDDFTKTIWQHSEEYEPTMINPFVIYFAEAINSTLFILPYNQYLIHINKSGYKVINLTGEEFNISLLNEFRK
jgi:hypothetical protein